MRTLVIALIASVVAVAVLTIGLLLWPVHHESGRPQGDHGTLLPTLSCWLDASLNSGGDTTWIALAVPHGATVDCGHIAKGLQGTLGSTYTVSVMKPVPLSQVAGSPCQGNLDGLRATAFDMSGGALAADYQVESAVGCN